MKLLEIVKLLLKEAENDNVIQFPKGGRNLPPSVVSGAGAKVIQMPQKKTYLTVDDTRLLHDVIYTMMKKEPFASKISDDLVHLANVLHVYYNTKNRQMPLHGMGQIAKKSFKELFSLLNLYKESIKMNSQDYKQLQDVERTFIKDVLNFPESEAKL